MPRPAILIVEEDGALRRRLHRLLDSEGIEVIDASGGSETLRSVASTALDLAIVGSSAIGAAPSLAVAQEIRRSWGAIPIIFITPKSSEQLAIAALRTGVRDYFTHPVPFDELAASVKRCLTAVALDPPSPGHGALGASTRMIGDGPRMREIHSYIAQVAAMESTVLITGETGTGKEITAALIHQASRRRQRPLVHINCAAIPDTLLESELFGYERGAFTGATAASAGKLKLADGGTVFFDEIGDMSTYAQAKILRLLESGEIERLGGRQSLPVNVRVIAATNQDLERLMIEGRFRKDLYFRLNVARIHLPALRERKEDLPALIDHYIRAFSRMLGREVDGITDEALAALLHHDWPGNVRELRNLVEAVFTRLRSRHISLADLPVLYRQVGNAGEIPQEAERDRLLAALLATKWNKSRAAERLHWSRMTVYRKMAKYHLVETEPTAAGPESSPTAGSVPAGTAT
jgi:DNA-binding NtrC family response regulator